MQLTLEEYTQELLPAWEYAMLRDADAEFADRIAWPWFSEIAPVKAEKYGMEAWLRLGVRALVVETNGGYFRWKRMLQIMTPAEDEDYLDTIRDVFGYSIMMGVLQHKVPEGLGLKYQNLFSDPNPRTASQYNEALIDEVWDNGIESMAFWYAFRMSVKMQKEGP